MRARSRNRNTTPLLLLLSLFLSSPFKVHNRQRTRCTGWRQPGATTPAARNWDILGSSAMSYPLAYTRWPRFPVTAMLLQPRRVRTRRPNIHFDFYPLLVRLLLLTHKRRSRGCQGLGQKQIAFSPLHKELYYSLLHINIWKMRAFKKYSSDYMYMEVGYFLYQELF